MTEQAANFGSVLGTVTNPEWLGRRQDYLPLPRPIPCIKSEAFAFLGTYFFLGACCCGAVWGGGCCGAI